MSRVLNMPYVGINVDNITQLQYLAAKVVMCSVLVTMQFLIYGLEDTNPPTPCLMRRLMRNCACGCAYLTQRLRSALRRIDTNTNPISDHIVTKYANNGYIAIDVSHQDIHSQYALQLDACIDLQTCQKLANMAHLIRLVRDAGGAIG
ncbi:hypothetical protein BDR07DRAFT_1380517 [Suillus spraguei]|nr:hypothetical protein BDR07DRAFT_1380517 [Suillus spraguei]